LMDEPFSAVDPVVRHELQNEMLRLQSELQKTIVFVTHDIDEALRLGERVAVFKDGSLQQYDEPAQLLAKPANEFVAKFIGLGRGYRWLQLIDAAGLPVHDVEQIAADSISGAGLPNGWAVVIDDAGAPVGWIDAEGLRRHRAGASLSESVSGIGALFRPGGNLSHALDAALSSPSGVGIAVDEGGKVVGGVLAADVLVAVEARRKG
jgi:osmoprotectant transport system ATP-binding protein